MRGISTLNIRGPCRFHPLKLSFKQNLLFDLGFHPFLDSAAASGKGNNSERLLKSLVVIGLRPIKFIDIDVEDNS